MEPKDTTNIDNPMIPQDSPNPEPAMPVESLVNSIPQTNAIDATKNVETAPLGGNAQGVTNLENAGTKNKTKRSPKKLMEMFPKKKLFVVSSVAIAFFLGITILASILKNTGPLPETPKEEPEQEKSNEFVEVSPEEVNGFKEYVSQTFEFTIKYPSKAKFLEPGTFNAPLETYRVIFAGERQDKELVEIQDLVEGYIINFTIHKDIVSNDLEKLTLDKRNSYIILCDDNATISAISEVTISGYKARRFSVQNCGVDYIQTLFLRNGDLFEINQVYKGDIGVRQVYMAETTDIVAMFKILNTLQPTPTDTWTLFKVERLFTFKYPSEYDTTCCSLAGPMDVPAKKIAIFADPKTAENTKDYQFNGFGVYHDKNETNVPFTQYIDTQRTLLVENYKLVVGLNPIVDSEEVEINGQKWVILKGYAWWGDLAFTQIPNKRDILIFVKTELKDSDIDFDDVFKDVLETVEFSST